MRTLAKYLSRMLDLDRMEALREKLGISMEEAARRAQLSGGRKQWWNIVRGTGDVRLSTLERVAAALGVKAKDLLK
jgi:transcriptional regulator with XRE-family HTH domain